MVTNFQGDKPTVSVIMNCLNCEKYLREAIDSMYAQTYTEWEIIFWDNASTDGSAGIAKSYDSRLRYFRGDKTIPLGEARNKALEQCQGEFIAFLDCDDLWLPEKLEKQISPFWTDPEIGIVICNSIYFNNKGYETQNFSSTKPPTGYIFSKLLCQNFIDVGSAVVRKSVLDRAGWHDERFNLIEDWDLFLRVSYIAKLEYIDKLLAKCRFHKESETWRSENIEKWPLEKKMMLEKFEKIYPNFRKKYGQEINKLEFQIYEQEAMLAWESGNSKKMRGLLNPYIEDNKFIKRQIFFSYFMSFKTYKMMKQLWGIFTNNRARLNMAEKNKA